MRERPILFSGEMVRAILDGRKTMTRRVMKPQPTPGATFGGFNCFGEAIFYPTEDCQLADNDLRRCPYGVPGDRLWVRENFAYITDFMALSVAVKYSADGTEKWFGSTNPKLIPDGAVVFNAHGKNYPGNVKYRPSIHMPRWASRITLEITDVHAQRIQEISEDDARAEGIPISEQFPGRYLTPAGDYAEPRIAFMRLWDSINAKRGFGWDSNLWVWAITFKRIEPFLVPGLNNGGL